MIKIKAFVDTSRHPIDPSTYEEHVIDLDRIEKVLEEAFNALVDNVGPNARKFTADAVQDLLADLSFSKDTSDDYPAPLCATYAEVK